MSDCTHPLIYLRPDKRWTCQCCGADFVPIKVTVKASSIIEGLRPEEQPASPVPRCPGYPDCDGDLVGEPHEPACPSHPGSTPPAGTTVTDEAQAVWEGHPSPAILDEMSMKYIREHPIPAKPQEAAPVRPPKPQPPIVPEHGWPSTEVWGRAFQYYAHQLEDYCSALEAQQAQSTERGTFSGVEMLERVRASLKDWPSGGGDIGCMKQMDRAFNDGVEAICKIADELSKPPATTPFGKGRMFGASKVARQGRSLKRTGGPDNG